MHLGFADDFYIKSGSAEIKYAAVSAPLICRGKVPAKTKKYPRNERHWNYYEQ